MKNHISEIVDLALTQAIERYSEMDTEQVYAAIDAEWPPQIATLMTELFFKTTCGNCSGMPDFIYVERDGDESSYLIPVCSCEGDRS